MPTIFVRVIRSESLYRAGHVELVWKRMGTSSDPCRQSGDALGIPVVNASIILKWISGVVTRLTDLIVDW
jgi:hypothetical protein